MTGPGRPAPAVHDGVGPARPFRPGGGVVAGFDGSRGLGTVRTEDGVELPFHCTALADGTRTVEVGRHVRFTVVPGHLGRWEAGDIIKQ